MLQKGIGFVVKSGGSLVILFALVVGVFALSVYVFLGRDAKESIVSQVMERKKIIARSGSASIESFFEQAGKSLVVLAQNPDVRGLGTNTQQAMDEFIANWAGTPFIALGYSNTDGKLTVIANRASDIGGLGISLVDRDYFIKAQKAKSGEVVYGESVVSRAGETEGQYVLPVATPVFNAQNERVGVLNGIVLLSELTSQYLDPLKHSTETQIFVVRSEDLVMVYSEDKTLVGKSVFDTISQADFLGKDLLQQKMQEAVERSNEGNLRIALPSGDGGIKLIPHLLAWSPMSLGDTSLLLVIIAPEDSLLGVVAPFYVRNVLLVYIGYMALLAVVIGLVKFWSKRQAIQEEHDLHGFKSHKK